MKYFFSYQKGTFHNLKVYKQLDLHQREKNLCKSKDSALVDLRASAKRQNAHFSPLAPISITSSAFILLIGVVFFFVKAMRGTYELKRMVRKIH